MISITKVVFSDMTLKGRGFQFFSIGSQWWKKTLIEPDVVVVCDNGLKAFTVPFTKNKVPVVFECHGSKFLEESKIGTVFSKEFGF
jgi:hypothetical protein